MDACASTITNAVPFAFWLVTHICVDPNSISRVHDELNSSIRKDIGPQAMHRQDSAALSSSCSVLFDIDILCRQPLLQSIYTEILRLYVRGYVARCPERSDLQINNWLYLKIKVILVSTDPAHFDPDIWNNQKRCASIALLLGGTIPSQARGSAKWTFAQAMWRR